VGGGEGGGDQVSINPIQAMQLGICMLMQWYSIEDLTFNPRFVSTSTTSEDMASFRKHFCNSEYTVLNEF
jgi:hypothetical protein